MTTDGHMTESIFDSLLPKLPLVVANHYLRSARRMLWLRGEKEASGICAHLHEELLKRELTAIGQRHRERQLEDERRNDA